MSRKLSSRHIQFIAFGGTVGAGLFLGSGRGIALGGPALLAAYMFCGGLVFIILRAIGEMALADPLRGSFGSYASKYLGSTAGFVTGWTYWALGMLGGGAEISAVGILMKHWLPDLPQWIPAFLTLVLIYLVNSRNVRVFGEWEFWFALVKVLAIVVVIGGGVVVLLAPAAFGVSGSGIANLWSHGGIFPNGAASLIPILPIALFAFGGAEVIGLTAMEAEDPERSLPRAVAGVSIRILLFYVGSMAVIMSLMPWTEYSADASPFVVAMQKIGIPFAGDIINLVVITSMISASSTSLFAAARILSSLAERSQAPVFLAHLSPAGNPGRAINVSAVGMVGIVFLNWLAPGDVLEAIMTGTALLILSVWLAILLSHFSFRRRKARAGLSTGTTYEMPLYPVAPIVAVLVILGTGALLAAESTTRPAFFLGLSWLVGLTVVHRVYARFLEVLDRESTSAPAKS